MKSNNLTKRFRTFVAKYRMNGTYEITRKEKHIIKLKSHFQIQCYDLTMELIGSQLVYSAEITLIVQKL